MSCPRLHHHMAKIFGTLAVLLSFSLQAQMGSEALVMMAKQGMAGSEAGVYISGADFGLTVADAVCDAASTTGGCPARIPWHEATGTPNLVMNGLAFFNSLQALKANQENEVVEKVEGEEPEAPAAGGAPAGNFKPPSIPNFNLGSLNTGVPNPARANNICKTDPKVFGCKPSDLDNLNKLESDYKLGKVDLGEVPEDFFSNMRKAANYVALNEDDITAGLGASAGSGGSGGGAGDNKGGATNAAGSFSISGAGNSLGGIGTLGPQNKEGLGAVLFNGSLIAVDDSTGKELTLWQRATRRYLGIQTGVQGTPRGNTLARMEYLRSQAMKKLKVTVDLSPKKKENVATIQTPNRSPASAGSH